MAEIAARIIKPFRSKRNVLFTVLIPNKQLKSIIIAVERISPTIAGLIPLSTACTPAYLRTFFRIAAIISIIINDGSTTPIVAASAPKTPPCDEPIKVAILTAIGPGVDSDTAIKLISSSSVSQPDDSTSSRISEIMPYPPPKDTAPILRKVKNNSRYIIVLLLSLFVLHSFYGVKQKSDYAAD